MSGVDTVRNAVEAFNEHQYETVVDAMTPDAVWNDIPAGVSAKGRDELIGYLQMWHDGFSNARVTDPTYSGDDSKVVVEFTGRGTQSAEFGPFPNNGGEFELRAVQIYTLDDSGKVSNVDLYYDTMTMLTQLGHMGE